MITTLLTTKRFAPLFWCQFFSALNDNFLKNALVILILYKITGLSAGSAGTLVTLAGAVFIAPFFILSALGGELADRHDKAEIAQKLKLVEIGVAGVAALGFLMHSIPILFIALGLFGVIAALFGPTKYGILPDHLATNELVAGNALVEGATFVAILGGTIAGGVVASGSGGSWTVAVAIMALAVACWLSARLIPSTTPQSPDLILTMNPWISTMALVKDVARDGRILTGVMVVSWAWLVGVIALSLLPTIVKTTLGGNEALTTTCLSIFTVGIAAGSLIAAKASHARPNLSLVPLGAILMGVFALDFGWLIGGAGEGVLKLTPQDMFTSFTGLRALIDLTGIAAGGGLFIVPAFAAVQNWADPAHRARVIAANNVINAAFMAGSLILVGVLQKMGVSLALIFAMVGIGSIIVALLVRRAWKAEIARGDL